MTSLKKTEATLLFCRISFLRHFDRQVHAAAPFVPRAVVEMHRIAEITRGEIDGAGGLSDMAIRGDLLPRFHARLFEQLLQFRNGKQLVRGVEQGVEEQVLGARNMSEAALARGRAV